MRFNIFLFVIFAILAAALGWAGYELAQTPTQAAPMAIVLAASFIIVGAARAINLGNERANFNSKAACSAYMVISLVTNIVFLFYEFKPAALFITNIILLVLFLLAMNLVIKARNY